MISNLFNLCKSLTVTSGVEAVFSFSLDFTSPHILLISSRAAISLLIKYTKLQLPRMVSPFLYHILELIAQSSEL